MRHKLSDDQPTLNNHPALKRDYLWRCDPICNRYSSIIEVFTVDEYRTFPTTAASQDR